MRPSANVLTFFASALDYPDGDVAKKCEGLIGELEGDRPDAAEAVREFEREAKRLSAEGLEEVYAGTFDLNPAACPYVGYHLFGESYKRGAFMAKLNAEYRSRGFEIGNELPDHLPLMLRFLATAGEGGIASRLLEEAIVPALTKMTRAFIGTDNIYGALVRSALLALQPPGYAPPGDMATELPVLESADNTAEE